MPLEAGQLSFAEEDGVDGFTVLLVVESADFVTDEEDRVMVGSPAVFVLITGVLGGLAAVLDVFDLVLMTGVFGGLDGGDFVVLAVAVDDFLIWLVDEVVTGVEGEVDVELVADFVVELELILLIDVGELEREELD